MLSTAIYLQFSLFMKGLLKFLLPVCRHITVSECGEGLERLSARPLQCMPLMPTAIPPQAPRYLVGLKVWLYATDLPIKIEKHKLAPRFVGPFPVAKRVKPVAIRLRWPPPVGVHPLSMSPSSKFCHPASSKSKQSV